MKWVIKCVCYILACFFGWWLAISVFNCTQAYIHLSSTVKDVVDICCETPHCYHVRRGPIPPDKAECVLRHLNVLVREGCQVLSYCSDDRTSPCDIDTCVTRGPLWCTWIALVQVFFFLICFIVLYFTMTTAQTI